MQAFAAKGVFTIAEWWNVHLFPAILAFLNAFKNHREIDVFSHVTSSILLILMTSTTSDTTQDWKKQLGKQIRDAREKLGLSQDELGSATRLTRQTINLYENGRRGPSIPAFARLTYALKTTFNVAGYSVHVQRQRAPAPPKPHFGVPYGRTKSYPGAILKIRPTTTKLTIETTVRRVVF